MLEIKVPYECTLCELSETYNGRPILLEIDHVNRDWLDDRLENLRFLCPNCHSQEDAVFYESEREKQASRIDAKPRAVRLPKTKLVKPQSAPKICLDCSAEIDSKASRCKPCAGRHIQPTKITWPPLEDLLHLVETTSYLAAGRELGVSDNAVRKRIKRLQQEALSNN